MVTRPLWVQKCGVAFILIKHRLFAAWVSSNADTLPISTQPSGTLTIKELTAPQKAQYLRCAHRTDTWREVTTLSLLVVGVEGEGVAGGHKARP